MSAILDCFHRATTELSARWIASSINNICCYNPGANKILNDLPVVEAYSAIIPCATTDDSAEWISNSIVKLLKDNELALKLFGTPIFFEKFRTMEKYATSDDAKSSFNKVLDAFTAAHVPPPSTLTAENDALISLIREQVARTQDALLKEKDKQIEEARNELKRAVADKDAHLQRERESSKIERVALEKQLELERAEHQQTRNLRHQIRMELRK